MVVNLRAAFSSLVLPVAFAAAALLLPQASFAAGETGPKTETWDDGTKKAVGRMVEGKRVGVWTFFRRDGKTDEEVSYGPAGDRHGPYVAYDEKGQRKEEGRYEKGKKEGPWTRFYSDEKVTGAYSRNRKSGIWTTWYSSGKKKEEGSYVPLPEQQEELKEGPWIKWREDGKVSSEVTYAIISFVNAKGQARKKSIRRGPFVDYRSNGTKAMECLFDDDKKNGPFTEWNENGKKTGQGAFKAGKRDGTWISWDSKERVTGETVYADGKEIQTSRTLYDYHERKSRQTMEKVEGGKKTTRETSWDYFDGGKLKSEQTTVDGKPDGRWTLWDEQGKVVKSITYANGVAIPDAPAAGPTAGPSLALFQKIVQQKEYDRAGLGLTAGKLPRAEQDALASILVQALVDSPGDQTLTIEKLWLATIDLCPDTPKAAEGYHRLTSLYRTGFDTPRHEKIVKLLEQLFARRTDDPELPRRKYTDNPLEFSPVRMLHQSYEELGRFEPIVAYYDEQVKKGTKLVDFDCFDYANALEKTGKGKQAVEWYEKCLAAAPDKTSVHAEIAKQKIAALKR